MGHFEYFSFGNSLFVKYINPHKYRLAFDQCAYIYFVASQNHITVIQFIRCKTPKHVVSDRIAFIPSYACFRSSMYLHPPCNTAPSGRENSM